MAWAVDRPEEGGVGIDDVEDEEATADAGVETPGVCGGVSVLLLHPLLLVFSLAGVPCCDVAASSFRVAIAENRLTVNQKLVISSKAFGESQQ